LEALLKIISNGFILNGDQSYLRMGWNIIDFVVVITSTVSIIMNG
jgi:voltage-dependent calcium channel L type alpha-1D